MNREVGREAKVGDLIVVRPDRHSRVWRLKGKVGTVERVEVSIGWTISVLARFGASLRWVSVHEFRVLDPIQAIALAGRKP